MRLHVNSFDGVDKVIDRAAEIRNATRQAIDVKEAKRVSANDSHMALAA